SRSDAAPLLLRAAKRLESIAPESSRARYLDALYASSVAGRLATTGTSVVEVARAASAAPQGATGAADLLLAGLAARFSEGYAAGVEALRSALRVFDGGVPEDEEPRLVRMVFVAALHLWDDDGFDTLSARWVALCRETGALSELPRALNSRALVLCLAGDLTAARSLVEESQATIEATGIDAAPFGAMGHAALRGDEATASALIQLSTAEALRRSDGARLSAAEWADAVLNNGLGRYEQALAASDHATGSHPDPFYANWALAEMIEAAARTDQRQTAARAHRRLAEMTSASGTNWALGIEARTRALVSDGDVAENLYRKAIERLEHTRIRVELARAHLVYGEWLRREGRRVEAREQLRAAHEMLASMGVDAFAGRAERELLATGEHVRIRVVETPEDLTGQEAQIARLARDGVSNAEIAARLFISRRTVEYHLSKVFTKLGIRSRHELDRVLPPEPSAALTS
ncbi:MAG TPA: LuxR C-terminal-related transcriptional regulator, partial [Solirubrobacteraceae bacterium]